MGPSLVAQLSDALSGLKLNVLYMADTREFQGDSITLPEHYLRDPYPFVSTDDEPFSRMPPTARERLDSSLAASIQRTDRWLTTEALSASSIGGNDARQRYADILRTIVSADLELPVDLPSAVSGLHDDLNSLQDVSTNFANFGLMSPLRHPPSRRHSPLQVLQLFPLWSRCCVPSWMPSALELMPLRPFTTN